MSKSLEDAIELALAEIADLDRQSGEHKRTVNGLCRLLSRPPMFPETDPTSNAPLRDDEFYGKPLATAVQEVLERRKRAGQGAATVADIYDSLVRGGFHFSTKNAENAKRNLYSSLQKNMKFHRLPNGSYGLTEWYPNVRKARDDQDSSGDGKAQSAGLDGNETQKDNGEEGLAEAKKTFDEPPTTPGDVNGQEEPGHQTKTARAKK